MLAGGIGSRFWPVSTPRRPKQLLPLGSPQPLIADTIERIAPLVAAERTLILTGAALAEPILEVLPRLGRDNLLLEPRARGTAPVLAWAAHRIARQDADAIMASLHADAVIHPDDGFRATLADLASLARTQRRLFTIGVPPTRPETGYGYIRIGEPVSADPEAFDVAAFVEKPDLPTAREYIASGEYLWNTGIFVWRAQDLLEEIRAHTPELAPLLELLDRDDVNAFFEQAPSLSIDEGVLERSRRVAVVRARFEWDDVGAWDAVARTRDADAKQNIVVGNAHAVDAEECIIWSEDEPLVVFGARDLVAVRANGVTLVAPRGRVAELKKLLEQLPPELRDLGGDVG